MRNSFTKLIESLDDDLTVMVQPVHEGNVPYIHIVVKDDIKTPLITIEDYEGKIEIHQAAKSRLPEKTLGNLIKNILDYTDTMYYSDASEYYYKGYIIAYCNYYNITRLEGRGDKFAYYELRQLASAADNSDCIIVRGELIRD